MKLSNLLQYHGEHRMRSSNSNSKNTGTVSSIGEKEIIRRLSNLFGSSLNKDVLIGPGSDDCAVLAMGNNECIVITTDMLHRKTDFPEQMSSWQIGWMSVAVNLSDIAAMGASPLGVLVAFGMEKSSDIEFIEDIAQGMHDCALEYGTSIIGGDIDTHDELTITGTAIGRMDRDKVIRRNGAKPGDILCVTGELGTAGAALFALENDVEVSSTIISSFFEPKPKVFEGIKLAKSGYATSMMDISDGLALSLYDIAESSNVGLIVNETDIPINQELKGVFDKEQLLNLSLYSGGDFQLIFTLKPDCVEQAMDLFTFSIIGKVVEYDKGIILNESSGKNSSICRKGYLQLENTGSISKL